MSRATPDITPILRRGLIESLIDDGLPQDEAETFADELMAWAKKRGAELRANRTATEGNDR